MAIKSLAQTLKDLATGIKNTITSITGSNATLTIIKGNGTTSTVTVNNVANAGAATKATQDSAGQQINSTYIKGLSVSGQTITYTKGNNTTGTITTQDTVYTHPNSGVTAGTYKSVIVNAQGHVTAGSNPTTLAGYGITDASLKGHTHSQYLTASSDLNVNKLKGVISLDNLPAGSLERLVKVTNDTARFALTTNDIQLGDTVKVESTKMMYIVKNITKLNSEDGYEQYTAGMASSVPWSGVTGKPSSYTPSTHTHDDRYYTESEINSKVNTINSSIGTKADKAHTHDDRYYTESEIDSKLAGKQGSLTATGSATKGMYIDSSGTAKAMTYSVNKDVPSDAKFTDTVYTHPNSGVTAGTYKSVTVNAQGHVTAGSNPTTLSGYGITDAPTKTGGGASGTWGINISGNSATATNAANANRLSSESGSNYLTIGSTTNSWSVIGSNPGNWLKSIRTTDIAPEYSIGNYSAAIAFGGADTKGIITHAYSSPSVKFAGGNGSTAVWKFTIGGGYNNEYYDLNNFPTKDGGGANGTWGINITGNATSATNADKLDGIHAASLFYDKGAWDADNWATIGAYQVDGNPPVSDAYGWGQVISSSTYNFRFQLYASHGYAGTGRLHYRTGYLDDKQPWNTILDSENYNLFTPTKTGGGASGTWGINITGNANNATQWNGLINDLITENNTDTWIPVLKDNKLQHTTKENMTVGKANTAGTADISKACSGNSATSTKLNSRGRQTAITAREEAGMYTHTVYDNGYPVPYGNVITVGGDGGGQLLLEWSGADKGIGHVFYRNRRDCIDSWSDWRTLAFTTDNVASATKLQTARTINIQDSSATNTGTGASFDGSRNATIKLPATIKANITGNCSGTATNITQRKSASAVTHADYSNNQAYVPDMSFMAFWNGAYNPGGNSNLTYSANGTIIGSKNISSQTVAKANKLTDYAFPSAHDISTSATVYIFLGTWSGTSDAYSLILDIYTGEGWNALANQNDHINLFVKDSYQDTASATSAFGGVAHRYSPVGKNANNFAVALYATAANSVNVYLVVGAGIYSMGFYTVSMNGGTWTHKGTGSTSAPGGTKQECINYDIMLTQKDSSGNIIIS